jgi:GR25 family glycosyltransferase involved in LPS biosynthesis
MESNIVVVVIVVLISIIALCYYPKTEKAGFVSPKSITDYDIYVINLDRSVDRLASIYNQLPFNFRRFTAIEGNDLNIKDMYAEGKITNKNLTRGMVGCYMSHVSLWENIVRDNKPAIIFEDDIRSRNKFTLTNDIEKLLRMIPDDWDLILLGYHDFKTNRGTVNKKIINSTICKLSGWLTGLHAYIIKPETVEKYLRVASPISDQIDHTLSNKVYPSLNIYGPIDSVLLFGYQGKTLIQDGRKLYTEL